MADLTYSVSQVARTIKKTPQTVRTWTGRYSDYLSESANPASGDPRRYTAADIETLATVANLTNQGLSHDDTLAQIATGARMALESPPDAPISAPGTISGPPAMADMLDRFIVRYEARIDDLEGKLTQEQEARRIAEVEAAQLRGRLEELERPPRWQFWRK